MYTSSRKQFSKQMSFFYCVRSAEGSMPPVAESGPRVGLTVGKVMGKAVDRNRIKRRLREVIRRNAQLLRLLPVDVILHPRRAVIDLDFEVLDREVAGGLPYDSAHRSEPLGQRTARCRGESCCHAISRRRMIYRHDLATASPLSPHRLPNLQGGDLAGVARLQPSQCLYLPTCSEYAYVALSRFGVLRGSWLTLGRIARCHPFAKGGLDPVPERDSSLVSHVSIPVDRLP